MTTVRRIWAVPAVKVALVLLGLIAVLVVFGAALSPDGALTQHPNDILQGPGGGHLLGTDYLGRDVLSRVLSGTRLSVVGALEAVAIALVVGGSPGLASAWFGPRFEWIALRISDTVMVLPFTVFAIAVVGTLGNGLQQSMLALGLLLAPLFFRVTRAVALGLRQQQYVEAAELMGASQWWVLRRHIWAKVLPTIAVTTAQAVGTALLVTASLTFLGLGVQPPAPTWGGMLASDLAYLTQQPLAPLYPGLMIMITVGSLNLLADAIRDTATDDVRRRRGWRGTLSVAAGSGLMAGLTGPVTPVSTEPVPASDLTPEEDEHERVPAA